ncbi:MAG TPA: hypothetical protein PJ982_01780, partial [Lacipirellulaceae bacterium]|nr:hypothetical protein [Lacipirellulaceae bacterium]
MIGVSLGYLFQGYGGGSKEYLFNGEPLHPREVDAMEAAIAGANLTESQRDGNRILVPRGRKAAYMKAIADAGALPANLDTLLAQEAGSIGLFGDGKTRDARLKAARERQLSMLIRMMDGVADAQVLYEERDAKSFQQRRSITATVMVRPAPGESVTHSRARMIRDAVSKALGGVQAADIAIFNLADGSQIQGGVDLNADSFDERYFQVRTTFEQITKAKVEDVLRHIPGVRVQVSAELDETLASQTRTVKPEGDPQTVSEETDQSEQRTTQVEDRGRPGLTANGPTGTPPDESVARNEQSNVTNTRTAANWVPSSEEVRQTSGLVPKHVRAAIAIPSEFLVKVWRERNPDAAPDARPSQDNIDQLAGLYEDSIKKLVTPLFPREPAEDPYPNVQVTVFQSLTPTPLDPPSQLSEALAWASANSGSLIMGAMAFAALLMLRSMVRSIPPVEPSVVLQMPAYVRGSEAGADGAYDDVGAASGTAAGANVASA